jgi:hypothetical protein
MKLRIDSKEAFKESKIGLQQHIVWEEKTGMVEDGPTPVMRFEHSQIRQYLDAIIKKSRAGILIPTGKSRRSIPQLIL